MRQGHQSADQALPHDAAVRGRRFEAEARVSRLPPDRWLRPAARPQPRRPSRRRYGGRWRIRARSRHTSRYSPCSPRPLSSETFAGSLAFTRRRRHPRPRETGFKGSRAYDAEGRAVPSTCGTARSSCTASLRAKGLARDAREFPSVQLSPFDYRVRSEIRRPATCDHCRRAPPAIGSTWRRVCWSGIATKGEAQRT